MAEDSMALGYALGQDSNNNCCNGSNGMFGGEWFWGIILVALLFGGFGGLGGGWGNNGGGGYAATFATQADIQRGFDTSNIVNKLDGISNGICDGFYAQNGAIMSGFNTTNMALANGFHGVDNAVCTLGYQTQNGFNMLGNQLSACCCDLRAGQADIKYQMAADACAIQNTIQNTTRDLIDNQNANYRGLMDFMVQSKIDQLQSENQNLKLAASQANQNAVLNAAMDANTAQIIRTLQQPQPVPSYPVPAPYPYCMPNGYGYSGYGNCGNGCGNSCNTGCC